MTRKIYLILFVFILLVPHISKATDKSISVESAVQAYFDKHYTDAASGFSTLFADQSDNSLLAYNAGNAYFKAGKQGLARLYYEKAQRLNPRFDDLNFNLGIINTNLKDNVTESFGDYLRRTVFFAANFLSVHELAVIALVVSFLFWTGAIVVKFRGKSLVGLKSFFAFVLYIYVLGGYFMKLDNDYFTRTGIVIESAVPVKASYLDREKPLFELHEATKVQIIDEQRFGDDQNWLRIELSSGQKGWVAAKAVGVI